MDGLHSRLPERSGAGFIKYHGVDCAEFLQRIRIIPQYACLGCFTDTPSDG
jgi:hypothetical protein